MTAISTVKPVRASRVRTFARSRAGRTVISIGVVVVALVAWQIGTALNPSIFFPTPLRIAQSSAELFFGGSASTLFLTPAITVDAAGTVARMLIGYVLGGVVGVLLGTLMGRSRAAREFSDPVVEFLRAIPATATLPLFIILLGGGDGMRVAFIAYGVLWFVLINTTMGVAAIHPTLTEMGRVFRQRPAQVVLRIVLPAASAKIFAGLRIGLTAALLLAVVSEFILATNGIGYRLVRASQSFDILGMWDWMALLAILGFVINTAFEAIEHRVLRWDRLARS